jgi:CheY-like chemotaxis protein
MKKFSRPGSAGSGKSDNKPVIFLAEDDDDDIFLFEQAFEGIKPDCQLNICKNGQEVIDGLTALKPTWPESIFLDINMPIQTGLECLLHIREHFSKTLPVFLLSTAKDKLTIEQARKLGATGYLSKPSSVDDLQSLLTSVLSIDWKSRSADDFYVHLLFPAANVSAL